MSSAVPPVDPLPIPYYACLGGVNAWAGCEMGLVASLPAILGRGNYFCSMTITRVLGLCKAIRTDTRSGAKEMAYPHRLWISL